MLKALLQIKIICSNFQEMFIKASSFLLSKYFDFYTLRSLLSDPGPNIISNKYVTNITTIFLRPICYLFCSALSKSVIVDWKQKF